MSEHNGHHGEAVIDEILSLPVPEGWIRTNLAAIGDVRLGRQRSPKNRSADHPTKYLRAANITWSGIDVSDVLDMEFRPAELEAYRLHPGDVLLSEASGSASEVGKPAIWNGELENCCFQNTVIRFRSKAVDPKFALVAFQHFARNAVFSRVAKGVGIHHLSADRFASMPFLLPPKNEQGRIVDKIEELFSDLDAGVVALERARENLKRYRASVLKASVEGFLTAEWRAKHRKVEPASWLLERILKERRRKWEADQLAKFSAAGKQPSKNWQTKYVEPTPPETSDRPELPEGWLWTCIGQCFEVRVGATPSRKVAIYWNGTIPWVSSGEVQFCRIGETREHITAEGLANSSTRLNPKGSVLLGMIGEGKTRGQVAILDIDACNNQNCAAIWVSTTPIEPTFVYCWLWSQYEATRRESSGNNQPALNKTRVENIPMPLPPLDEQAQIVAELAETLSQIDAADLAIDHGLVRAARLRQSLLKQAFEGKLVPQDPSDEPATVLLERLRDGRVVHESKSNGRFSSRTRPPRIRSNKDA
jgi:type I restriction enzyme S subunit